MIKWVHEICWIAIVLVLRSMEDKCIFSSLAFMKDKLHNQLGQHLNTTIHIFVEELFIQKNVPY
jgi:hypothetical protein